MAFRRSRRVSSRRRWSSSGFRRIRSGPMYVQPRVSRNVPRASTTHYHMTHPVGSFADSIIPATFPYFSCGAILNGVPTTNGLGGRIGNRIYMQSLVLNGQFWYNPFGAGSTGGLTLEPTLTAQMFLVYFPGRAPLTAGPHTYQDFLDTATTPLNPLPALDPRHVARVVYRKNIRFDLVPTGYTPAPTSQYNYQLGPRSLYSINMKIPLNMTTVFDNPASPTMDWSDIRSGHLILYFHAVNWATPLTFFDVQSRLAFVEY